MAHNHSHTRSYHKAFIIGIGLNIIFVIVETFYGLLANSSALLADAGHNAGDVLSLIFAWVAIWLASKKPNKKYTYGFKKATILASLLNAMLLFGATIAIGWSAIEKLKKPEPVVGSQVMIVAGIGVVINTITALFFVKGKKNDLNIMGAFLHMAADAGVSLGVVISGFLIVKTGLQWIDSIMSFFIIIIILWGTWRLFAESVRLALDAVPRGVDIDNIRSAILDLKGVQKIHDLHIWAMSTSENAMSAQILAPEANQDKLSRNIRTLLSEQFNIKHLTIQVEKNASNLNSREC